MRIDSEVIMKVINHINTADNGIQIKYFDRVNESLISPECFLKCASKQINMQNMNNSKTRTQEILEKVKEWDGIHKRQLMKFVNRILECTMLEHSDIEDYIQMRTNCSNIFTLRTLEWKNFLKRSLQNSNQFIMAITLENYQQKMTIDEQILQFEYQEELNKWLETVKQTYVKYSIGLNYHNLL